MFDWFKGNKGKETTNVVPFPDKKETGYITPESEKEKPATVFYRIGITDKNRVSFQMGYSEITMNKDGVNNLIQQLEVFRDQLSDNGEEDDQT